MIILRSQREIELIKQAGKITADTLTLLASKVVPGISTQELDEIAEKYIRQQDAIPACKGYFGFPASLCTSVNEQVVHGIPSVDKILCEGDIISLDLVVAKDGYMGDSAITVPVGKVNDDLLKLMQVTEESLRKGIEAAIVGNHVGDIGYAVSSFVKPHGYGVVEDYVGHGIGTDMHEEPEIPNFGTPGHGPLLEEGMVICIEPMINIGTKDVKVLKDEWTVVTKDHKRSAHFEHTLVITNNGPIVLTERS